MSSGPCVQRLLREQFLRTRHAVAHTDSVRAIDRLLIDNSIREAALLNGVKKAALPDVLHRGKEVWRLKENIPTPMKGDQILYGKDPNEPLSDL